MLRLTLCGGVALEADGRRLPDALLAGRQGRLVLAYLACERHRSVPREELAELVWGERLPASWASSLSAVVSKLRRLLSEAGLDGPTALASAFGSYRLHLPDDAWVDWDAAATAAVRAERAVGDGDAEAALSAAKETQEIARRGFLTDDSMWVDAQRELLRELHVRAAHAEVEAHLLMGARARAVESARAALAVDELREASYRLLMQALAAAGERGEALRVWERCRALLVDELGTDPAPETEAVYLSILGDAPVEAGATLPSGVVTFLLTDIVESSALWERNPAGMATALQRHDELATETARAHGGVLLKAKLEGDATVSVFPRASSGAFAALALREALLTEAWPADAAPAVRMALHTGEAIERDGDYFGPALNRAARLRSLAGGGQILVSQAVAEVVRDHLPDGITLRSLGERHLRGLARGEHVFELAPTTGVGDSAESGDLAPPEMPAVLSTSAPFVGRSPELARLATDWATATAGTARATFVAGEPGVGKTRLAAEWARQAHGEGALVLYGRCDEELGAPYQPFAEALRTLVPHLGSHRLRSIRGVEELARLVPELADIVPGLAGPSPGDPDTERYLLFDAVARLLTGVAAELPILIVVDDLHWAAKPTLLLLRHLLRSGDGVRLQIVGTYRSTDLNRTHPLAGVLADLHRDGVADRFNLAGLDADDVSTYLSAAGHDDAQLGAALATVTSGNPFFLIEVLRHVEESGGEWDRSTLPQGVREAVGRRLARLSDEANEALLVAAVAGSQFSLELIEHVLERDLVESVDEARQAGLLVEERGNRFRFNHALVRQSLLTEVASVKRVRLHQRIAAALEADTAITGDAHLADLARHYFECAFAGGAAKAVDYSRQAGEHAMARLAYEEAADLYDQAFQAADIDGSGSSDEERAELLLARCEALLAAGDPTAAIAVVEQLERAARNSPRLSAWARCFAGQLAVLAHPERLDVTAEEVAAAAQQFATMDDAEGEAKAHTVRASCLARLGRIADCEAALDQALTAGRRAGNPRLVNAVLAGAPLAALWGPSPVARASGRCLDVVRVLRITTGSPAVEAIALRSQAVLEALRGRTDAARRMLNSARQSLEGLGHTHGLLETDLFSGIVELLAEQPVDAEAVLRRAYDGFVARGVGVDAAQAAALLARAVLAQGRADEAIALTEDSERLAGVDLKAAIAWRLARAEALAQQGRARDALEAAVAAVALADRTDALIDQADAHLALAVVSRAAGDEPGAQREARRAIELYDRKGATARVDAVRVLMGATPAIPAPTAPTSTRRRVRSNLATAAQLRDEPAAEVLASLGERHGLARLPAREGVEPALVEVARTDALGAVVHRERFDSDDLTLAFSRLVELHAEDEMPPARLDGRMRIAGYLTNKTPFSWSDDAVLADHRRASLGTLRGRDEIRDAGRALREIAGDIWRRITDVLAASERVLLFEMQTEGRTESGDLFELPMLALGEYDPDGLAIRAEWFEPEQVDEALARFDELTAATSSASTAPRRRVRPNRASLCLVGPLDPDHIAAWTAQLPDDFAGVDHRMHLSMSRNDMIATWRSMTADRHATLETTTLATLGERHCLTRYEWRGGDPAAQPTVAGPAEVTWLNVVRADTNGRVRHMEQFDARELNLALARLYELHADEELSTDRRDAQSSKAAMLRNANTRWRDDAVLVDHRPTSLGTITGRDAIATAAGALRDVAGDQRRRIIDVLGMTEDISLLELVTTGNADSGGPFEITLFSLNEIGDDGLCAQQDWYSPEHVDEALARFDELTTVTSSTSPSRRVRPNFASQSLAGGPMDSEHLETWSAQLRKDFAAVDHRMQLSLSRSDMLATWRLMAADTHARLDGTTLATLGERHCLTRYVWRAGDPAASTRVAGPAEVAWLNVARTDANGQVARMEQFGPDELSLALARLYELHADDELPSDQHDRQYRAAAMARAANTLRAGDVRHRIVDVLGVRERLSLVQVVAEGSTEAGAPFEISLLSLTVIGDDGFSPHQEWYELEQVDEALARFDELAAQPAAEIPTNRALLVLDRINDAVLRRDMAAFSAVTHEDAVVEDRRSLVQCRFEGRAECAAYAASLSAAGVTDIRAVVLATRGDRLALRREWYRGSEGEAEILYLGEIAPDGLNLAGCVLDPDDVDAAFDELDARYLAGEGRPHIATLEPIGGLLAAYNAQDWARWRALLADDFVVVDHRPAPAVFDGLGGADQFTAAIQQTFELASHVRARALAIDVGVGSTAIVRTTTTATTPEGAEIELAFHLAFAVDAGKITRLEFFAVEHLAAARARLDELSGTTSRRHTIDAPSNAAFRHWDALMALFAERDWKGLAAGVAEGAVADDRRPIVGLRHEGRDALVDMWRGTAAIGVTHVASTPIATRGERGVLSGLLFIGSAGEVELLFAQMFDENGLFVDGTGFDTNDLAAAFAKLDANFAAELPPECVQAWEVSTRPADRYNARDLKGLRDVFTDDAAIIDDRVIGWGPLDRDAFVDHLQQLLGMAPDAFLACVEVYEVAPHGSVGRLQVTGTVPEGGPFELAFECVNIVHGEKLARLELLPPGQVEEALRRFRACNPRPQPS